MTDGGRSGPADDPGRKRRGLVVVAAAYLGAAGAAWLVAVALGPGHPVLVAAVADAVATAVVFAFSAGAGNSSVYDPYWSVAPVPIALYWASTSDGAPLRVGLVLLLVTVWAVRLTANCLARWGGLDDEDFRYREIRGRTGRLYWPASFVSIHLMPTVWVFLGMLPVYAALASSRPLGWLDALATIVTGGAVAVETLADAQLRRFLRERRDPAAVLDTGLWAYSRHPNYFGEVLFWWGLWLFGVAADPAWTWSVVGPVSITLLFTFVSVPWMDRRMASRHPAWAAVRDRTSALVPRARARR